jgi:hypothetical protein
MTKVHIFSVVTLCNKLVPQFPVLLSQKPNLFCIAVVIVIIIVIIIILLLLF